MNDRNYPANSRRGDKQLPKSDGQQPLHGLAVSDGLPRFGISSNRAYSRWLTTGIILAFWIMQFTAFSTYQFLMLLSEPETKLNLFPRALVSGCGVILSFAIVEVQNRLRSQRLSVRAFAAILLALVGALIHALINHAVFYVFIEDFGRGSPFWVTLAYEVLDRLWIFVSISVIALAISYSGDIRDREERIGTLQALAHDAQLRALRNQLNPHFLFNALNSVAGLLSRRRGSEAETMTENLADFLRATLAIDPQSLITLSDEIRLQELYLAIEKVRFPDRLKVTVEVPKNLNDVLVPSLITQPLVENSIKYAVARSTEPVALRIAARLSSGWLELVVEDDGGNAETGSLRGSRLGLANVAERLKAHYAGDAALESSPKKAGGFRNVIRLPLRRV